MKGDHLGDLDIDWLIEC